MCRRLWVLEEGRIRLPIQGALALRHEQQHSKLSFSKIWVGWSQSVIVTTFVPAQVDPPLMKPTEEPGKQPVVHARPTFAQSSVHEGFVPALA